MKYERMQKGIFRERPNRFIAYIDIDGNQQTVHVKNTGRCRELLIPGTRVYVQESDNPERKTRWDLIGVEKGERMINMDSQIPNRIVKEWVEEGNLFSDVTLVQPEVTYKNSRFDLYVETKEKKIFIEVKGVTLEEDGVVRFPDAPSERALKHVTELMDAKKNGYEAYVFFVIQMKGVRYFTPNVDTQPEFGEILRKAKEAGVHIIAYDCHVTDDSIEIAENVPVILGNPQFMEIVQPITQWYLENRRDLPWRNHPDAYRVWVSEIMLQQTRVEAVKPYYERFLKELPSVKELAETKEEKLLKLWEGLGYYNRIRNMQKAAIQVMEEHQGNFPDTFEEILSLKGIGNYTAGAIASFAFGLPKPAVDGNVLRVISRITASYDDIMKASVKTRIEKALEEVIPADASSAFNQGLIELGAIVCVPNGEPRCEICPVAHICKAHIQGIEMELPVKKKAKARRIEKKTILIFKDGETVALNKRAKTGLLAGMYEFPSLPGHQDNDRIIEYSKSIGLTPIRVKPLTEAKHIFSHVEWHMTGYVVQVDELEKACTQPFVFVHPREAEDKYPIPSAFEAYVRYMDIKLGQSRHSKE
ncbi:MAG: A/G-specific adenine glycosylase [Hespellia sp.]|nr:A/G-specific adenine glycosylase [Hespellia sp.]